MNDTEVALSSNPIRRMKEASLENESAAFPWQAIVDVPVLDLNVLDHGARLASFIQKVEARSEMTAVTSGNRDQKTDLYKVKQGNISK